MPNKANRTTYDGVLRPEEHPARVVRFGTTEAMLSAIDFLMGECIRLNPAGAQQYRIIARNNEAEVVPSKQELDRREAGATKALSLFGSQRFTKKKAVKVKGFPTETKGGFKGLRSPDGREFL